MHKTWAIALAAGGLLVGMAAALAFTRASAAAGSELDTRLAQVLSAAGFTGRIEATLELRLGRALNPQLVEVGRQLWFDTLTGLNDDNTCGGCHSPTAGFGDTQSIAIGIDNNGQVGPHRTGPRNMRRTPTVINTAFYPNLMWNSRFAALSGDPFDNGAGFEFPSQKVCHYLTSQPVLLTAQAFIPPTERNEVVGFDFVGDNDARRAAVMQRLNASAAYRQLFGAVFPAVSAGGPVTYAMFAQAIAEFEFSLTFADAPLDQFARGRHAALTADEKQGALLFFGEAGCVGCHSVAGPANEMFSDFLDHNAGVPPLLPRLTNADFDGPGLNEDFGREEVTHDPADRFKFRTTPLRNLAVQPAFMHNGAFTSLADALRFHLDPLGSAATYTPAGAGVAADLSGPLGPWPPVLARLDPRLATPVVLTDAQFGQLLAFVSHGLLDPRARPENLRRLEPTAVPSGQPVLVFEYP